MYNRELYLGRNRRGERVWVEVKLSDDGRLSLTGETVPRGTQRRHERGAAGQIIMDPDALPKTPLGRRVAAVWERWHLNDMHAECVHQRARGETWANAPGAVCPQCGHRLGSAWLREDLPPEVIEEVRSWRSEGEGRTRPLLGRTGSRARRRAGAR